MSASTFIQSTIDILTEFFPTLNTKIGSSLYYLNILPNAKVSENTDTAIQNISDNVAILTANEEYQSKLIDNFGVPLIVGKQGTGQIAVTLSTSVSVYPFPAGTEFTNENGDVLVTTTEVSFEPTETNNVVILDVQTLTNTNSVFEVGTSFTPSIFGNLVLSSVISKQVDGGVLDETNTDAITRIKNSLTQTPTNPAGIKFYVFQEFPSIIDIIIRKQNVLNREQLGRSTNKVPIDCIIKTSLIEKTVSLSITNNIVELSDIIIKVTNSSLTIQSIEVKNRGTSYEKNTLTFSENTGSVTLTYLSTNDIKDIQTLFDTPDKFPYGVDLIAVQADPIFVSGSITTTTSIGDIQQYILSHLVTNFDIADMIESVPLKDFNLPIQLTFDNIYTNEVVTTSTIYENLSGGYYFSDITI